ncbi:SusD/RagB family nutrient-binding outer membrane lipoprotein [Cesiribacter sp. SM1]|uniref:SusD/RagB family nutrient-binding outer membrane lipoprotein n=1 Tax=Cesiribacter sp. SM1 TaxID=2861196 RepID=UPI001CD3771E|nr:SusD/RagB family nutrient-binding outer membrane lipoprotein [Cesiribacter sp. SM1]
MKRLLYISILTLFFIGCDDRLEELNTDQRNPAEVDPTSLFAQGLRQTHDNMASISVNNNPFNLYAQYWAQTTYPDESQYNLVTRSIPFFFWRGVYRDALAQFQEARELTVAQVESGTSGIDEAVLQNRLAALDIMIGYNYHVLVDVFGDVPYTEALDPDNLEPVYDDARTIYNSVIENLQAATASINPEEPGFPANQDPMYFGDMEKWQKFGNSLLLRLGMRLADVDPAASVSIVNNALAGGVFESNADNASLAYLGASPNTNPIYEDLVLSGRADFVAANTLVDIMNDLEDPRRAAYFRQNLGEGVYQGGVYGSANNYGANTQIGDALHQPDFPSTLLNYAEVEFLQAEAAERGGYSVSGSAAEHYHAGIEASFNQWGLSDAAAAAYIAQPEVNYTTAPGDWRQKIGLQLWLALYNEGFEAWSTWRRLDFVALTPPEDMDMSDIPLRFTYPLEEGQLNNPNYTAAASRLEGGDVVGSTIFWDTLQPLL